MRRKSLTRGRKLLLIVSFLTLIIPLAAFLWMARPMDEPLEPIDIYNPKFFIAHAGGEINGFRYSNSKEAVLLSLSKGYKYIELDLYVTSDSNVVCLHSIDDFNIFTGSDIQRINTNDFKKRKLLGKYSQMTLKEAVEIWESSNFTFVADKVSAPDILNKFFRSHRDNVWVETIDAGNYAQLEKDGYVPLFTLGKDVRGLLRFLYTKVICGCKMERIVVYGKTTPAILRFYKRMGAQVYVFGVNSQDYMKKYLGKEVDMMYTDFWIPKRRSENGQ